MKQTLTFNLEKETPGTFRYKELELEPGKYTIGTMYLRKSILAGTPAPKQLTVTIEG